MDAYSVIRTKRDTRVYLDKPIGGLSVHRILQAGRMAGSSKNSQPARFVVLEEPAIKNELSGCGDFAKHVPVAALVVAIVMPDEASVFDAGRCAQNMMLAAWAEGITSCPVSMHDADCALRVLGVPPGNKVPIVLTFGYPPPDGALGRGQGRIPLEELVHRGGW